MQLVGARKSFIQRPFLVRASGYGIAAGIVASALLWSLIRYATSKIEDLALIQNNERILLLFGVLLLTGMLIAVISTYLSMRRYLKMSLDELY